MTTVRRFFKRRELYSGRGDGLSRWQILRVTTSSALSCWKTKFVTHICRVLSSVLIAFFSTPRFLINTSLFIYDVGRRKNCRYFVFESCPRFASHRGKRLTGRTTRARVFHVIFIWRQTLMIFAHIVASIGSMKNFALINSIKYLSTVVDDALQEHALSDSQVHPVPMPTGRPPFPKTVDVTKSLFAITNERLISRNFVFFYLAFQTFVVFARLYVK